ncbi:glycoside hydrolase family 16 protein [Nocardioides sp. B-3]|uniref:glycoside hydrolase family 16 protein n=1 Tax=Nocardioides sp. B-3 TaxID=2895565 RepID=UPI00215321D3|nr:family 16 glycosylhydrolase [Nocardioides sp. B-3]UUZ60745.1 family 16 glycosylhydrolase [Nocardioides sp. B-3]
MPASLLMVSATTTADAADAPLNTTNARKAKSKAKLVAMPQIVQQGSKPASANSAKAALTATIKPAKAGRPVALRAEGQEVEDGLEDQAHEEGSRRVRCPDLQARQGAELPRHRCGVQGCQGRHQQVHQHLPLADRVVHRRVLRLHALGHWNHRGPNYEPASLRECSKGSPSAVSVSGGTVRLSVIKDPTRSGEKCVAKKDGKSTGSFAYRLNGHIGTEGAVSMKYGFAAARIKTHKLRGQHGGFWMRPTVAAGGDPRAEIDVIEYFGDKHPSGGLTSFIYSTKNNQAVKTGSWIKNSTSFLKNKKDGWSKNYHVFSVEWTRSVYIFRIDGKETRRTKVGISDQEQFPILSVLASDYEISQMKGGDSKLPQTMAVDWVRLWQA